MRLNKKRVIVCFILGVGLFLRLIGLNWDQSYHLHPDERFLTMVGTAIQLPNNIVEYFNPTRSALNPANHGFNFFVYGMFPLILNKVVAVLAGNDNYHLFTLQGRALSAVADTISILFVVLLTSFFARTYKWKEEVVYSAGFLYAIAVLPVQLSHFFTVDPFLNLFMLASLYFSLHKKTWAVSAIFLGLAAASKINAVFIMPLIICVLFYTNGFNKRMFLLYLFYGLISYVVLRFGSPYMFQTGNLLNPNPSQLFISNLQQLKTLDSVQAQFPPAIQWTHTAPVLYSLYNLAFYGLGIPVFTLSVAGLILAIKSHKKSLITILAVWVLLMFLYQSVQYSKPMRYLYILYPYLAMFAGVGLVWIKERVSRYLTGALLISLILWPLCFIAIYFVPHSRVNASIWMYQNAPTKSTILVEHWDDAVPLPMEEQLSKQFILTELPVFDPDSLDKMNQIQTMLRQADYYVLSSNRGWGSIANAPDRYPLMSGFYNDLLSDKTTYKKVAEFTAYPSLRYLGIPLEIKDDQADESFTVYDHPKVMIFENTKKLNQ